jgi:hypothetical protein
MFIHSHAAYSTKILGTVIIDIIYFPFWWYFKGLGKVIVSLINFLKNREKALAFFVWVKNIFTPMYGQEDWQGRLISFAIRLIQIIFRGAIMIFWLILALAGLALWIIFPPLILFEIYLQIV